MPYDDDPYWGGFTKKSPTDAKNSATAPRSLPDAKDVLALAEQLHRAQNPSPLLKEWLEKKGLDVK